jgi:hypothetical protein
MKLVLAFVLVVAACKQQDKAPTPAPAPSTAAPADAAPADAVAAPQPCPTDQALKDAIAKALSIKADTVTEVSCNELAAPRKLWAVDVITMPGMFQGTLALLDARDGALLFKENTGESDRGLAKAAIIVADLDGNGTDELLRSATSGANGFANETLYVLALRGDKLAEITKLPVRSENTGAVAIKMAKDKDHYECQSTVKVIDGPPGKKPTKLIEIVGAKRKGKVPAAECPPVGRRTYAFDGKVLKPAK